MTATLLAMREFQGNKVYRTDGNGPNFFIPTVPA